MIIHQATFVGSYTNYKQAPTDDLSEFAFIGRSNVGKSSLINSLLERKGLARISNVPGKTQELNYYRINDAWYLVDLPGYGYAQVSKKIRNAWKRMMDQYFLKRDPLVCVFVLVDANIAPQKIDIDFINWLGENGLPFILLYTKSDRCKAQELEDNINKIRTALLEFWEELPQNIATSANTNMGREEVLAVIEKTLLLLEEG